MPAVGQLCRGGESVALQEACTVVSCGLSEPKCLRENGVSPKSSWTRCSATTAMLTRLLGSISLPMSLPLLEPGGLEPSVKEAASPTAHRNGALMASSPDSERRPTSLSTSPGVWPARPGGPSGWGPGDSSAGLRLLRGGCLGDLSSQISPWFLAGAGQKPP